MQNKKKIEQLKAGLILHKDYISEDNKQYLVYKLELQRFKTVEFTADFSESENIILVENNNYQIKENMIAVSFHQGFDIKIVAKLNLLIGHIVKPKFGYNFGNISREQQYEYVKPKLLEVNNEIKKFEFDINTQQMSIKQIMKTIDGTKFVDKEFPPNEKSITQNDKLQFNNENIVQFKRLKEIFSTNTDIVLYEEGLKRGGEYIQMGCLMNPHVYAGLCAINEKVGIIERIIENQVINQQGVYYSRIFWEGLQHTIVVDDFFPCLPLGEPLLANQLEFNDKVECWALVIEKCICKLVQGYYYIKLLNFKDVMYILTGCPTMTISLNEKSQEDLFTMLKTYVSNNWVVALQSQFDEEQEQQKIDNQQMGIIESFSYVVLNVYELGSNQIIQLRNHNKQIKYQSQLVQQLLDNQSYKNILDYDNQNLDYNLFISIQECVRIFQNLNVCFLQNFEETKVRGKFVRIKDVDNEQLEVVQSRMYYTVRLNQPQQIFVSLFQEDEIDENVREQRSALDLGIVILRKNNDNSVMLENYRDYQFGSQFQARFDLQEGSYIILPKTIGTNIKLNQYQKEREVDLLNTGDKFVQCIYQHMFDSLDILMKGYLNREELYELQNLLNIKVDKQTIDQYCAKYKNIKPQAFCNMMSELVQLYNYDIQKFKFMVLQKQLGYDEKYFNNSQRNFTIQVYSEKPIEMVVRDCLVTDLDIRTNLIVVSKYGKEFEVPKGIRAYYTFHQNVHGYGYVILNEQIFPITATLDSSESHNMHYSTVSAKITKTIDPGALEFMQFVQAIPGVSEYKRKVNCYWVQSQLYK